MRKLSEKQFVIPSLCLLAACAGRNVGVPLKEVGKAVGEVVPHTSRAVTPIPTTTRTPVSTASPPPTPTATTVPSETPTPTPAPPATVGGIVARLAVDGDDDHDRGALAGYGREGEGERP